MAASLALLLAVIAGFAAQRGSICAVAAVRDLILRRDAQRYLAFLEASLWMLATLGVLSLFAPAPVHADHAASALSAAGGALFGIGAVINGACAFGSAARLARGDLSFLFMPAGMIAGAHVVSLLLPAPAAVAHAPQHAPLLALALVFFVGWRVFGAIDSVRSGAALRAALLAAEWPPAAAMAAIGVSSALLAAVFAPWPYSTLLIEIAAGRQAMDIAKRALVALAFIAGAYLAARLAGAVRLAPPRLALSLQKFAGGALMGAGAYLVPGGNDALVLGALPNLFAYGFIAYATMTAAIAAAILIERRLTPAPRRA